MSTQPLEPRTPRRSAHDLVDGALPFVLTLAGLLHPESVRIWFESLGASFVVIAGLVLGGAGLVELVSRRPGGGSRGRG